MQHLRYLWIIGSRIAISLSFLHQHCAREGSILFLSNNLFTAQSFRTGEFSHGTSRILIFNRTRLAVSPRSNMWACILKQPMYDRRHRRHRSRNSIEARGGAHVDGVSVRSRRRTVESSGIVLANQAGRIYMRFMAFRLPSVPTPLPIARVMRPTIVTSVRVCPGPGSMPIAFPRNRDSVSQVVS